jgi:hypothetical protein
VELTWDSDDWAHPAIEVRDGVVWVTHPNGHTLTSSDGASIETDLLELHYLRWPWAVDTGSKRYVHGPDFETVRRDGRVVRLDDGFELARPYPQETKYSPTAVAVDPRGSIWVADGYGQSLVHRYSEGGELELTLDGFATPRMRSPSSTGCSSSATARTAAFRNTTSTAACCARSRRASS